MSAIRCIRHFLVSHNSNDVHLFMACLNCVDVDAWAGTSPDNAAALDKLEFERIMQLLNFPDQVLRKMVSLLQFFDFLYGLITSRR
jgi:AP-4 complex subunit epsilon-1